MSESTRTPPCPIFGSRDVIPVVHGYPTGIGVREAKQGLIRLVGCLPRGGTWEDKWACRVCDAGWPSGGSGTNTARPDQGERPDLWGTIHGMVERGRDGAGRTRRDAPTAAACGGARAGSRTGPAARAPRRDDARGRDLAAGRSR